MKKFILVGILLLLTVLVYPQNISFRLNPIINTIITDSTIIFETPFLDKIKVNYKIYADTIDDNIYIISYMSKNCNKINLVNKSLPNRFILFRKIILIQTVI